MMSERRYGEEEVAEILDRATAPDHDLSRLAGQTGLTLAQIQEIGSEAGISSERIAQAALSVTRATSVSPSGPTLLGTPRSVERVVHLKRAPTDEEWSRLVADLRETFEAEGQLESHGTLRSWRNGHLTVHLEPDGDGYRIRMGSLHGTSAGALGGALLMVSAGIGLAILTTTAKVTGSEDVLFGVLAAIAGLGGVGSVAYMRAILPKWALERETQMEGLARRIPLLLE